MFKVPVIALASILLFCGVAHAQDDDLKCSDEDIFATIDEALAHLEEAKSLDAIIALESLSEVRTVLANLDAECRGLTFSGTAGTVHGPVTVPEGIYRASVTTNRFFIMGGVVLEGSCGDGLDTLYVFNEHTDGDFTAETIFRSEGCTALFETSNIFGPYTVTFEKVR